MSIGSMPNPPTNKAVSRVMKLSIRSAIFYSLLTILIIPIDARAEKPIAEYPEAQAHLLCLKEIGERFATQDGDNLELARKASRQCRKTRQRLAAILIVSASDTDRAIEMLEESDYNTISQLIWERRRNRH